jgi:hypothetical protein
MRQGIGTLIIGAGAAVLVLAVAFYSVSGKTGSDATQSIQTAQPG